MNTTNWLFLIFVLILFGLALFNTDYLIKKDTANFERFDSTDIRGIISGEIYQGGSGVHVTINGYGKEFVFDYHPNSIDEIFSYVAKRGDSIIKPVHSDTLTLITTGDEIYKYVIKKH